MAKEIRFSRHTPHSHESIWLNKGIAMASGASARHGTAVGHRCLCRPLRREWAWPLATTSVGRPHRFCGEETWEAALKPRTAPSRWPPACLRTRVEADGRGRVEGDGCIVHAGSVLVHGLRGEREGRVRTLAHQCGLRASRRASAPEGVTASCAGHRPLPS